MAFRSSTSVTANAGSVTSLTVSQPAGLASGDVIILQWENGGASNSTITWPSGFTELANGSQDNPDTITHRLAWKVAGGSEPATYQVTSSTSDFATLVAACWSGRDVGVTPSVQVTNGTTSSSSPITVAATGITAANGDDIAWFATTSPTGGGVGTWTPPSGYTEREDAQAQFYSSSSLATRDNVSAGATGTLSGVLTGSSDAGYSVVVVAIKKAAGGATDIAGSTSVTFTHSAIGQALRNAVALTALTVASAAALGGYVNGRAATSITLSQNASIGAYRNAQAASSVSFTSSVGLGAFRNGQGSTALSFALSGALSTSSGLTGTTSIAFSSSADLSGLSVVSVDSDNVITPTQIGATFTGVEMGANISARSVHIVQSGVSVVQTQVSGNDTSGAFDVVFDPADVGSPTPLHLKYGAATFQVTTVDGTASEAITIAAPAGRSYVDVATPNTTAGNRITAVPDLESGDQLEISNVQGTGSPTPTIADVSVYDDATFDCDASVTSFDVRVWSATERLWGSVGTQSIGGSITGSSTLTLSAAATASALRNAVGATTLSFTANGYATMLRSAGGGASILFTDHAVLGALASASASSGLALTGQATSSARAAVAGTASIVFSGQAVSGSGPVNISGSTSLTTSAVAVAGSYRNASATIVGLSLSAEAQVIGYAQCAGSVRMSVDTGVSTLSAYGTLSGSVAVTFLPTATPASQFTPGVTLFSVRLERRSYRVPSQRHQH